MGRIDELCALIDCCASFADVGCDHGYCAGYALKHGLCDRAIISDVSQKCLNKAERLLDGYIRKGVCTPVCCDGLALIPRTVEQVMIAGMGGEEIIKILTEGFIPQKFILQPMKNVPKLRKFLLDSGCKITLDDMIRDDKFYFVIKGECPRDGVRESYSPRELFFGRDSLSNPLIAAYAAAELKKRNNILLSATGDTSRIEEEIKLLNEVLNDGRKGIGDA